MYDTFESDSYLFNNDIFFLVEARLKEDILQLTREKHVREIEDDLSVVDKRNDLLIWNAIYIREIIKSGISKKYLHPSYNKFYKSAQVSNDLKELQSLELKMIEAHLDILINDVQITDNYIINRILNYLHINIESHVSLEKLSKDLSISMGYASDIFKKHMGISVMLYSKRLKIERAKTLLLNTDKSILDIGILLGFYDQSHFSRTFKSIAGVSPTEYRNKKAEN
ncbi:AraC family transcriptional regulator [Clostridium swellfunianum]|uniref:helix-turn-helix domain-containing protein n=1 Tax=Clostridium swellfunianum TaxID=1367462 RepID=UPI00202E9477|nr:AraC family transcriptional regulator [Clostridium swellfunianum]MCM0649503.1 AraC family transcriptional regulator [Clostridium swellfunianum]